MKRGPYARKRAHQQGLESLTDREREVYLLVVVESMRDQDIADIMQISVETVSRHLSTVMNKMGMSSRVELAVQYYRQGIPKMLGRLRTR